MCKSVRGLSEIATEQVDHDFFLSTIDNICLTTKPWTADVKVNGMLIRFKVDTGADVTAIPLKIFQKLVGIKLHPPKKVLHGPTKHPLKVSGQFTGTLLYNQCETQGEIFVVEELLQPLLGLPAIESINLLSRINRTSSTDDFVNLYPDLFNGLGSLSVKYQIQLKQNSKPFALCTPRFLFCTQCMCVCACVFVALFL